MINNIQQPNAKIRMFVLVIVGCFLYSINSQPTFSDNCFNFNATSGSCQQCNPGFYLQYFFCVPCNANCACTSSQDYCDYCLPLNYNGLNFYSYLDQQQNQCFLCNASMPNCLKCKNNHFCTQCFNGQYLVQKSDLNGTVIQQYCSPNVCTLNCQFCLNDHQCEQCQQGYFLFANKTCSSQPCTNNCSICASTTHCQTCSVGTYLDTSHGTNSCQPCITNCTQCTNSTNCQICAPATYLVNGTCSGITTFSNCVQYYNSFAGCSACQPGYQVTGGSCNQCFGCNLCIELFICLSPCLPGYAPFNFQCIPNSSNNMKFSLILMAILISIIF